MEATNLADLYDSPLMEWDRIAARLDAGLSQAPETGGLAPRPGATQRPLVLTAVSG